MRLSRIGAIGFRTLDMDRENESDLVIASDAVTPATRAFVMKPARLICVVMEGGRLDTLDIPRMVSQNAEPHEAAFTASVD